MTAIRYDGYPEQRPQQPRDGDPCGCEEESSRVQELRETLEEEQQYLLDLEHQLAVAVSSAGGHTKRGALWLGEDPPLGVNPPDSSFINSLSPDQREKLINIAKLIKERFDGAKASGASVSSPGTTSDGTPYTGAIGGPLEQRWREFLGDNAMTGFTDINQLIQWVMREAYLDNMEDLRLVATKVRYYNEVKKKIREELTQAREYLANNAVGKNSEDVLGGPGYNYVDVQSADVPEFVDGEPRVRAFPPTTIGDGSAVTKGTHENYIKTLEEKLTTMGDDAQLAQVDLQNWSQKQQQTLQLMSNLSKSLHDLSMSVIRKIGG